MFLCIDNCNSDSVEVFNEVHFSRMVFFSIWVIWNVILINRMALISQLTYQGCFRGRWFLVYLLQQFCHNLVLIIKCWLINISQWLREKLSKSLMRQDCLVMLLFLHSPVKSLLLLRQKYLKSLRRIKGFLKPFQFLLQMTWSMMISFDNITRSLSLFLNQVLQPRLLHLQKR